MTLAEVQRQMLGAILRPRSDAGRAAGDGIEADVFIKPNPLLTATERLEIYRQSYWARVLGCLREDFPGLRAVVGARGFDALAEAYLAECPSRSFTLRDLGSRLEAWLVGNPGYLRGRETLATDMARLEWAHVEAFDAPEWEPLGPEDLLEPNADTVFALQPCVRPVAARHAVDDLRLLVERDPARGGTVAGRFWRRRREPVFLAAHRVACMVYYRRLEPDEFRILEEIRKRKSLGEAVGEAASRSDLAPADFAAGVEGWFAEWARLGWLCSPFGHALSHGNES